MNSQALLDATADVRSRMSNMSNIAPAITDASTFDDCARALQDIKGIAKQVDALQKSFTVPLEKEKKDVIAWFRETFITQLERSERLLKAAILEWQAQQDRKRREEQQRAEDAARKERERLARLAERANARGDEDKAEQHLARSEAIVAAPVAVASSKAPGISTRSVFEYEITDASLLPREYLLPDDKRIGAVVRAMKMDTNIPGIKVIERKTIAATS
jgi:hypothetical protein